MEACGGHESPSITSADHDQAEAKVAMRVPKVEVNDVCKAVTVKVQKVVTFAEAAPAMTKSVQSNGESQKISNGSVDVDKKATSQFLEGLEARFVQRCEVDLCLDEKTSEQALQLFRKSKPILLANIGTFGAGTVEETERLWNACILFAVKRLSTETSSGDDKMEDKVVGFTLSQILKATKLSILEFFKEFPQFLSKAGRKLKSMYGDDWEKRLMAKEVQADFYYLTVLFNYYKRVYNNLFVSVERARGTTNGLSSGQNGGAGNSVHMQFGWLLFLALRMRVLSRFVDLVTYINGLLAVVIIMILHMPPSLRKFSFEDGTFFQERAADGRVKIVASICAKYHDASEEDVSKMVEKASNMIGELFRKSSGFRTRSHAEQLAGIDTEGLAYFEGLMDERSIAFNLRTVAKDYEEAYHSRGELDERMFINGDDTMIGSLSNGTFSNGTPTSSGSKRKYDSSSGPNQTAALSTGACPSSPTSPYSSPVKANTAVTNSRMPPSTPVSVTMSTVKWLRTYVSPLPAQPSPELQHFFRSCDHDISAEVTHRTRVLLEGIFSLDGAHKSRDSRGIASLDSTWVEQRRLEAAKLYYRVLTAMCKAESQRLLSNNLTALLTRDRFHRCMIACSAELVLYTHKTVTMTFPAVLEPSGITAFDLSKVIESFVRHEETLPRELKRHLNSMEQQILESMAWEKGSSLYNNLIEAKKHLAPIINRLCLLADPMPALDNMSQQSRVFPGIVQREPDGACEGSGVPSSPPRVATIGPSNENGVHTSTNGLGDTASDLFSPVKERPSAFSAFSSPVKSRLQPPLQSAFASPQRPSPLGGGETCAETVINVFFQKVLKLAAVRIKDLCERLHQSNQVWEQVYRIMQHILYKETSLFFKRHIDQLILCSIYGICKVNKANVTFKNCIEHYGKQPQCKRHVFCNVFIHLLPKSGRPETGDIIRFYNQVFVPATKQYLLHLGQTAAPPALTGGRTGEEEKDDKDGPRPCSPSPAFPALPDMSPKKVSASHNVYVSPMRSTKMDTLMSPHTRSLYACVGESTHAYQSPSKDLTAINNRLNKRRLGSLDFTGASLVSDSHLGRLDFNEASQVNDSVAVSLFPSTRSANHGRVDFKEGSLVSDSRLGRLDFNETSRVSESLVTGSLYPCNKNANHHSVLLTTDSVLSGQSQPSWTMAPPLPPSPLKRPRADR